MRFASQRSADVVGPGVPEAVAVSKGRTQLNDEPVSERRVTVRGLSTSYLEAGTGPVLLLVHGNVTSCQSWRRVIEEFRTTHRVLAVSLPGYGGTSPQGEVRLDGLLSFLTDFLDLLSIEKAVVLGHSAGGVLAATLALAQPERVTRLVLMDSAGLGRAVNPAVIAASLLPEWAGKAVITALLLPGASIPRALAGGLQLRRPWRVDIREWREQIRTTQARTLLSTSLQLVRTAVGPTGQRSAFSITRRLGELRMPTLVVWGLTDELFPLWQGVRAARRIPRGRLAVLAGAGHVGFLDSFVEFVDAVGPFVRDDVGAPSIPDGGNGCGGEDG